MNNGWSEWQKKVLGDIEDGKEEARRQSDRRDAQIEKLIERVSGLEAEVKALRAIAALVGGLFGVISGLAASLFSRVK